LLNFCSRLFLVCAPHLSIHPQTANQIHAAVPLPSKRPAPPSTPLPHTLPLEAPRSISPPSSSGLRKRLVACQPHITSQNRAPPCIPQKR
jgi:hypothetical protein